MVNNTENIDVRLNTGVRIVITILLTFGIIPVGLFLVAYMMPTIMATARKLPDIKSIAIANILVAWTGIGWVAMVIYVAWKVTGTLGAKPVYVSRNGDQV